MSETYLFNSLFVFIAACLVFFMQAGFALLETGMTRVKNTTNVLFKNTMDFGMGCIGFFVIGYGLMYGDDWNGIIGISNFLDPFRAGIDAGDLSPYMFFFFQLVFCAATATIVSGGVCGRMKFSTYLVASFFISAVIYPVSGHWIWGGGWLSNLGYMDFAGSSAVHMAGGVIACVGAAVVGPRIGKFNKDGSANSIQGHNISMATLGLFVLWLGWYGFNPGSGLAFNEDALYICITTTMAGATAGITVLLLTWALYKKPDLSMVINGILGGLVGVTAGCKNVSILASMIIGIIAGFVAVFGIKLVDKMKVDDPVGAVTVHGLCGATGVICVGLFASRETDMLGLFYGGGFKLLGIQIIGILAVAAWCIVASFIMFEIMKKTVGIRVSEKVELNGLDIEEHGVYAYPEFTMAMDSTLQIDGGDTNKTIPGIQNAKVSVSEAVPVNDVRVSGDRISNVVLIFNQEKFRAVKDAMNDIGVTGMTITQVMGYGVQKGLDKVYRGVTVHDNILPKVKVEFVVCSVPLDKVIETARKVLYTGNIGDGKIFVYNVENVVRVSTGEQDKAALAQY